MTNNFFVSCIESRMEQETSWYSRFEIGPFQAGQALTVANSLRRTLLSDQQGVFLTAVEIDGAIHEYSRLEGVKESILDILLNLRQISLLSNTELDEKTNEFETQETFVGYFDLQGPLEIRAKDLKFPKQIECGNPNQLIATLTRNCSFQGRFLVMANPTRTFKNQSIGDPLMFSKPAGKTELHNQFVNKNWLYVNPITNSIRRVNYIVEQFGDVWEQTEVVNLEVWTNGATHPKQAIQRACLKLSALFSSLSSINPNSFKLTSSISRFKKAKLETNLDTTITLKSTTDHYRGEQLRSPSGLGDISIDKLTLLFDLDIANLNLSLKTYLSLKKAKIENIGNLLHYPKADLIKFLNVSQNQMEEIESSLTVFGLSF